VRVGYAVATLTIPTLTALKAAAAAAAIAVADAADYGCLKVPVQATFAFATAWYPVTFINRLQSTTLGIFSLQPFALSDDAKTLKPSKFAYNGFTIAVKLNAVVGAGVADSLIYVVNCDLYLLMEAAMLAIMTGYVPAVANTNQFICNRCLFGNQLKIACNVYDAVNSVCT
jgi:hypothetical protein